MVVLNRVGFYRIGTRFGCVAFACAFLLSLDGCRNCSQDDFVVAGRGRAADCRIVIPADGTPCHRTAAEELVRWTEAVSGVRLEIGTDAEPLPDRAVVLGPTKYTQELLGNDGGEIYPESAFRLKLNGRRMVVSAGTDQSVLYGVYEVLQRYGKVEFYTPVTIRSSRRFRKGRRCPSACAASGSGDRAKSEGEWKWTNRIDTRTSCGRTSSTSGSTRGPIAT